jgi:hypothetical protein
MPFHAATSVCHQARPFERHIGRLTPILPPKPGEVRLRAKAAGVSCDRLAFISRRQFSRRSFVQRRLQHT